VFVRNGISRTRSLPLVSGQERGWSLSGSYIQQRGKSFSVYAYAGVNPVTKRPMRKYLGTFLSRREAERCRVELAHHPLYSAMIGSAGSPRLRLESYVSTWIDEREALGKIRSHTAVGYRERARLDIFPSLGYVPLARLSPPMIQALYTRLLRDRGLAPATVKQAASILHASLRDAVRQGVIMKNPAAQCSAPSVPDHREMSVWTEAQLAAYLTDAAVTATPSVLAFYITMVATGCRPGELAGAPEDAIDFERAMLRVRTNLVSPGRQPVFDEPKTQTGHRTIKLPPEAVEALRAGLLWKKAQRLRLGPRFHDGRTLFCTPRGRPLDRRVLRARDHLPRLRRLNLPDARIYDLRHLNISYSIAAGVDLRTVADRAGHKDPGYLIRRYAHAVAAAQERAVDVASNLLAKPAGVAR
jgi:integrase